MKRFLSCVTLFFIFLFIGAINIDAAGLIIECPSTAPLKRAFEVKVTVNSYAPVDILMNAPELERTSGNRTYSQQANGTTIKLKYSAERNGEYTITASPTNGVSGINSASCKVRVGNTPSTTKKTISKTTPKKTTTTKAKSNNANINSLTIKDQDGAVLEYSPKFNSEVYEYNVTAISSVTKVQVEASMEDAKSNIVISDNVNDELVAGQTTKITLTVTAEDGTTKKSYVVNVSKEALNADASIKSLIIKQVPNFKLKDGIARYELLIDKSVDKLDIKCVPNNEKATCKISGNESLKNGSEVKVLVTAEDLTTKKEYTLTIKKQSKKENKIEMKDIKDPLIIMSLSIIAFALIGGIFYTVKR